MRKKLLTIFSHSATTVYNLITCKTVSIETPTQHSIYDSYKLLSFWKPLLSTTSIIVRGSIDYGFGSARPQ